jgi:sigma-B regulation protein RsbU (phosphoserine phosphatase)
MASHEVLAHVLGTPRLLARQLFAGTSEYDTVLWIGLVAVASGLTTLYAVAVLVALYMIVGLSRAVNRLSRATGAVQRGEFAVRIPVRRRDQVGALQTSFNEMAAHLQDLVATAAQKEVLEKELAIARELQESLLPRDLPQGDGVEFATLFEPSAALGGDYFDILRLDQARLAVMIADVSGHGLSSGLRMAMLKAAFSILIEQEESPAAILRRLDTLVRGSAEERFFVTATLSLIDLAGGRVELWNAGHPPTYLLRRGDAREIVLPGSPLGSLGQAYGHATIELAAGDVLVWLSDGFIEATDSGGEPFGYERVLEALSGAGATILEVRARLLSAVERHAAGQPADDDRTLVVMGYRAPAIEAAAGAAAAVEAVPAIPRVR